MGEREKKYNIVLKYKATHAYARVAEGVKGV